MESAPTLLGPWSSFYVMTGSSAAALTGLMFVVITLTNDSERLRRAPDGIATFSTPVVMHLTAALLVSALLCAPWHSLAYVDVLIGLAGLYGIYYVARVFVRAKGLTSYALDLEDWSWYMVLPFLAYSAMLAGAIAARAIPVQALFAVAAAVLSLIFIGIRNAWDIVTFIATGGPDRPGPD